MSRPASRAGDLGATRAPASLVSVSRITTRARAARPRRSLAFELRTPSRCAGCRVGVKSLRRVRAARGGVEGGGHRRIIRAGSRVAIGAAGAAAAQCARSGPNCRCRPSISFPPASGSRICAASGRSPSRCASISPRSRRSTRRRLSSTASLPRARPSTASTRDSASLPGRASTTHVSRSCSARSCCRIPPAPERCSTRPSSDSSWRSRRPRSPAATRGCAGR